jgi:hypothetical protein
VDLLNVSRKNGRKMVNVSPSPFVKLELKFHFHPSPVYEDIPQCGPLIRESGKPSTVLPITWPLGYSTHPRGAYKSPDVANGIHENEMKKNYEKYTRCYLR